MSFHKAAIGAAHHNSVKLSQARQRENVARMKTRSLALTHVQKFMDTTTGKRTIRGIATTSSVDRVGDVVVPSGGQWTLPVPLLWQHKNDEPVGWVREITPQGNGLSVVCEIATGIPKADEVWAMVESKLVSSFSIGFAGLKGKPISTGMQWDAWELLELSVVTIPANLDARITATKGTTTHAPVKLSTGAVSLLRNRSTV
jgi:HK97 family phage prohead protease